MGVQKLISHNLWWKLLSLLLAALTYLTIQTAFQKDQNLRDNPVEGSFTRSFPGIPITLLTSSTNLMRYKVDPPAVVIRLSGAREALSKLQEKQIHVYVDVSTVKDEKQFRGVVQTQVPDGIKVDNLIPIVVNVERLSVTNF